MRESNASAAASVVDAAGWAAAFVWRQLLVGCGCLSLRRAAVDHSSGTNAMQASQQSDSPVESIGSAGQSVDE